MVQFNFLLNIQSRLKSHTLQVQPSPGERTTCQKNLTWNNSGGKKKKCNTSANLIAQWDLNVATMHNKNQWETTEPLLFFLWVQFKACRELANCLYSAEMPQPPSGQGFSNVPTVCRASGERWISPFQVTVQNKGPGCLLSVLALTFCL